MTRTGRRKAAWIAAVIGVAAAIGFTLDAVGAPLWAWWVTGAILLVPGRVQAWFFRDLRRGRRLLESGAFAEALPHFRRFAEEAERRPWLQRLLWFGWSPYTDDLVAMARNNEGAAYLGMELLADAEGSFRAALDRDPEYGLAAWNLALVLRAAGREAEARGMEERAGVLGYGHGPSDRAFGAMSGVSARLP